MSHQILTKAPKYVLAAFMLGFGTMCLAELLIVATGNY